MFQASPTTTRMIEIHDSNAISADLLRRKSPNLRRTPTRITPRFPITHIFMMMTIILVMTSDRDYRSTVEAYQAMPALLSERVIAHYNRYEGVASRLSFLTLFALTPREREIQQKITAFKRQGKLVKKESPSSEWKNVDSMFVPDNTMWESDLDRENDLDENDDVEEDDSAKNTNDDDNTQYARKINERLGPMAQRKLRELNRGSVPSPGERSRTARWSEAPQEESNLIPNPSTATNIARQAQIGTLRSQVPIDSSNDGSNTFTPFQTPATDPNMDTASAVGKKSFNIDPTLFENNDDDDISEEDFLSEEELVELVAEKMAIRKQQAAQAKLDALKQSTQAYYQQQRIQQQELESQTQSSMETVSQSTLNQQQLTTGVGGSWSKTEDTEEVDLYQPKTGSWGAFPRPRDISKAYGGGRRIGPGYSNESEQVNAAQQSQEDETRERLRRYREKVGIIVQSEQDHQDEINDALRIAGYAMQRGVYSAAVSALEKVSQYCSSNSKVGGKVFLELGMAYEAVGRTEEAIIVYRTLSSSRIEEIKLNAKKLLYGIEAMQFMRDEVGSKAFSRQKIKNTFIDTTGLANIAQNFDDVYNTAWIDIDGGFYRRLTESVVRSTREARQILLRATCAGEVERLRIVQALRSLQRRFDEALQEEMDRAPTTKEISSSDDNTNINNPSVAMIDGKPIVAASSNRRKDNEGLQASLLNLDEFILANADQMRESLTGEWRLQLLADRRGDGVKFFNTTLSWQTIDMDQLSFTAVGPAGFLTLQQSGRIEFDPERRILSRQGIQRSGSGSVLAGWLGGYSGGATGAVSAPQQVISVDSILLVTRRDPRTVKSDDDREFFAVWRRMGIDPSSVESVQRELEINL